MRGTSAVLAPGATVFSSSVDSARMLEALADRRRHRAYKIPEPRGRDAAVGVEIGIRDHDGGGIAAPEQLGLRLQDLAPIGVDRVLAIDPIPAPDEQARGTAAQLRFDWPDTLDSEVGCVRFPGVTPFHVAGDDERVLRGDELRTTALIAVVADIQPGARGVF